MFVAGKSLYMMFQNKVIPQEENRHGHFLSGYILTKDWALLEMGEQAMPINKLTLLKRKGKLK